MEKIALTTPVTVTPVGAGGCGVGLGVGLGVGCGVGLGVGLGVGCGVGFGVGCGAKLGDGFGVAAAVDEAGLAAGRAGGGAVGLTVTTAWAALAVAEACPWGDAELLPDGLPVLLLSPQAATTRLPASASMSGMV